MEIEIKRAKSGLPGRASRPNNAAYWSLHAMLASALAAPSGAAFAQGPGLNDDFSLHGPSIVVAANEDSPHAENWRRQQADSTLMPPLDREAIFSDDQPIEGAEVIRERFPDGSLKVARQVILDADGNYVNHGSFSQWNAEGQKIVSGQFVLGIRQGVWSKTCLTEDSPLFAAYPYNAFEPPFQSTAEFLGGHLDGTWIITDAHGQVVSEIQLSVGTREGQAVWYHPAGAVMYKAEYLGGILHGDFVENDAEGKEIRSISYNMGQRVESEKQNDNHGRLVAEYGYLTAPQILLSNDQWHTAQPARYKAEGGRVKHGPFVTYHPDGRVDWQGEFSHGELNGEVQRWYPNGQRRLAGQYEMGQPIGHWTWWHDNGMPQIKGNYDDPSSAPWMAWNTDGNRITDKVSPPLAPTASDLVRDQDHPTTRPGRSFGSHGRTVGPTRGNAYQNRSRR